ncbi:hypothetical protein E2562_029992 [Oryza meyeriana var. granulata]|uniref:Uncharacterized protein n=1 Tax=Oryza meyeriana var. granulata TaxID=110450 RepID=A0A6G1ER89_9ORYZ|nr:hypothetical protein E2562_029992 [Oryza meyeriana var. granulata]
MAATTPDRPGVTSWYQGQPFCTLVRSRIHNCSLVMKRKGKMPEKVKKVTFTRSQSECEIILQETQAEQLVNPGD